MMAKKSPKSRAHLIGGDQRSYQLKVKDIRSRFQERQGADLKLKPIERHRQPDLANIASEYDLKLFKEAQAVASEKIVCVLLVIFQFLEFIPRKLNCLTNRTLATPSILKWDVSKWKFGIRAPTPKIMPNFRNSTCANTA